MYIILIFIIILYILYHTIYLICIFFFIPANADIFFDLSLRRLSGNLANLPTPQLYGRNTILALLKWVFNGEQESMTLNVRTDSQRKLLLLCYIY